MRLISLAKDPAKPSLLCKWDDVCVLLDLGIDFTPLYHFLPSTLVESTRLSTLPGWKPGDKRLGDLKICAGQVFIDSKPEITVADFSLVDIDQIDAVFVSNYGSLLGLPFLCQHPDFRAAIYATDPTIQLGRLLIEELIEYFERIPKPESKGKWKLKDIFNGFPTKLTTDPNTWCQMYTKEALRDCMASIELVAYKETVDVHGLVSLTPYSSGYCIGSCNWLIETDYERIGYMGGTSAVTAHPRALDTEHLKQCDALIVTSLSLSPVQHPDSMLGEFCATVVNTLKSGGSVLIPCIPTGVLYDLLECVGAHLDKHVGLSETPLYLVSPVADNTLASANIFAEWLSEGKQSKVYLPEDPFPHAQQVKNKRLKPYSAIYRNMCSDFKTPCVVFAGHPSLRIGDAVHFMELWRNDPRNAVILTDSEFSMAQVLAPYQPLAMKAFFYPIDTRLDFTQLKNILEDIRPKALYFSDLYTRPPSSHPTHEGLVVEREGGVSFKQGEVIHIDIESKHKKVKLEYTLANSLKMQAFESEDVSVSPLIGCLSAYDNHLELKPLNGSSSGTKKRHHREMESQDTKVPPLHPKLCGKIEPQNLINNLQKEGILDAKLESQREKSFTISAPSSSLKVEVENGVTTTILCDEHTDDKSRNAAKNAILKCLILL